VPPVLSLCCLCRAVTRIQAVAANPTPLGRVNLGLMGTSIMGPLLGWRLRLAHELMQEAAAIKSAAGGALVEDLTTAYTPEEDAKILMGRFVYGQKWLRIHRLLPNR